VPFSSQNASGDQVPFILFEQPLYNGDDIFVMVDGFARIKARPTLTSVAVKAALTLAGPRYTYTATSGAGSNDAQLTEPGLRREVVINVDGTGATDIPYADGDTPDEKAAALAATLLTGQTLIRRGGFRRYLVPGDTGVTLNGMIDRVSIEVSAAAVAEEVEFTAEWASRAFTPDRQFDRIQRDLNLYPGQSELRARQRADAIVSQIFRQSPYLRKAISASYHQTLGEAEPSGSVTVHPPAGGWGGTTTLPSGVPLWKTAVKNRPKPVAPADSTAEDTPVFAGVTVTHENPVAQNMPVATSGRVLVRALGPVAEGDSLGMSPGHDYLEVNGFPSVGVAQGRIASGTKLVWCDLGGGGSTGVGTAVYA
jgi:hypothetical protein